jgi:DNA ligase (NAD+)
MNKTELEKIINNPKVYTKDISETQLVKILKELSDNYYNDDEQLVDDDVYDTLISELKKKNPNNNFLKSVGAPIKGNMKKVTLPFYTGSLDKKKPDTKDLTRWLDDYEGECVISDKLDGDSSVLHSVEGKLQMYTRGNGFIGKDISHLIKLIFDEDFLNELPKKNFTVRGELIVTKKDFEKLYEQITTSNDQKIKNARNMISIIINSKTIDSRIKKIIECTHFVTYKVFDPILKPSDQMKWLDKHGFEVVDYKVVEDLDEEYLHKRLLERKKKSIYEIDGLVVVHNKIYKLIPDKDPKHAFAYKLPSASVDVKVLDVIWEASKYGYLKPKVLIEKTSLSGVDIKYATAHNARFIVDNEIGPGAIITITRAGEVIPKILDVVKPAKKIKYPSFDYEWNKSKVDLILVDKKEDKLVLIKDIASFFKTIGVDNLGQGIVTKLVNDGYNSIKKIIEADVDDIAEIEGLGNKSATKIKKSINKCLTELTLSKFMAATLIFGRLYGEKRCIAILKEYPNIVDDYEKYDEKKLVNMISDIDGFNTKTSKQFVKMLPVFIKFVDHMKNTIDVKKILKNVPKKKKNADGNLSGKRIVFTGFRDKQLQSKVEDHDGKVSTAVSKNTDIVVAKDIDEDSSKIEKAKKLGITMMTIDQFKKKYGF